MTAKRSASNDSNLCQFPFADGRRCRMLRHKDHTALCIFHARIERQLLDSEKLGGEISESLSGNFFSALDVNHVLGKLFEAIARNRLPRRNAAMLSYIGQLLLHSVPMVRHEIINAHDTNTWRRMVYNTLHGNSSEPAANSAAKLDSPRPT